MSQLVKLTCKANLNQGEAGGEHGLAVLPTRGRTPEGEVPHPAEVLADSSEACRAEALRLLAVKRFIAEGNLWDLRKFLSRSRFRDRTFFEEVLLRVLEVRCALGTDDAEAVPRALNRLHARLKMGGSPGVVEVLGVFLKGAVVEAQERCAKALHSSEPALLAADPPSEAASAAYALGRSFAASLMDPALPLMSLGPGAFMALYFGADSAADDPESAVACLELHEPVGRIPAGAFRPEKLIELWRREKKPLEMPEAFLRLAVEAGSRTTPKSADMRLFRPLMALYPELFGSALELRLWQARIAAGESRWTEADRALFDFAEGMLSDAAGGIAGQDQNFRTHLWAQAARLAAWSARARFEQAPKPRAVRPYPAHEEELIDRTHPARSESTPEAAQKVDQR